MVNSSCSYSDFFSILISSPPHIHIMGVGRTMTVTIKSARGLAEKESGAEICDPYVIICFDGFTQNTIGRTTTVADNASPVWNEKFPVDLSAAVREHSSMGLEKPKTLSFIIRDADTEEALGMTNIPLKTLLTTGSIEGEYEINEGTGILCVNVEIRPAKVGSMTSSSRSIKARSRSSRSLDPGDLLLRYLLKRNKRRKKREKQKYNSSYHSGGAWNGGGVGYGYYDTDSSDEENQLVDWYDMDDVSSDESEGNVWFSGYNDGWSTSSDEHRSDSDSSDSDDGDDDDGDDDDDDDYGSD